MTANNENSGHSLDNESLKEFYTDRGFAGRVGFGERPAVLVIDLAKAWTDPSSPLGSDLSGVLDQTVRILEVARRKKLPIFFTTMAYEPDLKDAGEVIARKLSHQQVTVKGSEWIELHPALEFDPDEEVLIVKQRASAFFGTTFLSQLVAKRVDTLIITGCSTSGCVRATAQDAHDHNLHLSVPREAVGDRSPTAHEANLFDIDARMGDVRPVEDVLAYLEDLTG